jgi:hypothetical protein
MSPVDSLRQNTGQRNVPEVQQNFNTDFSEVTYIPVFQTIVNCCNDKLLLLFKLLLQTGRKSFGLLDLWCSCFSNK